MLVDFGNAGLVQKALQQPERVKQVLRKAATDGLLTTIDAVRSKLDEPLPLGYSNVGVVRANGGRSEFGVGDRVVSNGPHAEMVSVPGNLCARVPDEVTDESASFVILGAIALQGIRLAAPTLGEAFVVMGLGPIGQLAVQLLVANGCRVLGVDLDPGRCELARRAGAETTNPAKGADTVTEAMRFSRGRGVDGVLLTLSAKSHEPVSTAAAICRKRARLVLVGVTGLNLKREDFYEKELSLQVSCSYGPGRYDVAYEEQGHDYPAAFVRWTEQRNFEAVLDMMAKGAVDPEPLISHRYDVTEAGVAYDVLVNDPSSNGILIRYPSPISEREDTTIEIPSGPAATAADTPGVSFVGAGNYAGRILIPAFRRAGARLDVVATRGGVSGVHYGKKHGFRSVTTNLADVMHGEARVVVVATSHDSHAALAIEALQSGKHVFVEKPLALTLDEISDIEASVADTEGTLTVGYNRRFSPSVSAIKQSLAKLSEPPAMVITVNAGSVPADHWTQDLRLGGGRIVGEACHFVDLARHLADAPIHTWQVVPFGHEGPRDNAMIQLGFTNGATASIQYVTNGSAGFPKERVEVFCGGRVARIENFLSLKTWGWSGLGRQRRLRQDKGQNQMTRRFLEAAGRGLPLIPYAELFEVGRVVVEIASAVENKD